MVCGFGLRHSRQQGYTAHPLVAHPFWKSPVKHHPQPQTIASDLLSFTFILIIVQSNSVCVVFNITYTFMINI